jgi:hypothetical protein
MRHHYETDAAGNLLHFIDETHRATVAPANVSAYVHGLDFDGQLQYSNVQAKLEQERAAAAAAAKAKEAAANAQIASLVERLVAQKLAELSAARLPA